MNETHSLKWRISFSQSTKWKDRSNNYVSHALARAASRVGEAEWTGGRGTGMATLSSRAAEASAQEPDKHNPFCLTHWITESHLSFLADSNLIWRVWWILPALHWDLTFFFFLEKVKDLRDFIWDLVVLSNLYESYMLGQTYNILLHIWS